MKTLLATLTTEPLELRRMSAPTEIGVFEVEIEIDKVKMRNSGDPFGFFKHELALHLAQAILDTGVPRENWYVVFEKETQIMFNLPEGGKCG